MMTEPTSANAIDTVLSCWPRPIQRVLARRPLLDFSNSTWFDTVVSNPSVP